MLAGMPSRLSRSSAFPAASRNLRQFLSPVSSSVSASFLRSNSKSFRVAQPWLYMERLGWVAVTVAAATATTALAYLHPTFEQRRLLVTWLFGSPPGDVAETVRITGAVAGLVRRGLRGH